MPRACCAPPWTPAEHDVGYLRLTASRATRCDGSTPARHALVGGEDPLPHGRQKKDVDQVRIEERAATLEQDATGLFHGAAVTVLPPVSDGVEGVGDGDDACGERDTATLEPTRISRAIPTLVMRENTLLHVGIEAGQGLQHVGAATWVSGDGTAFGGSEALHVVDDVEQRFMDLADVVEERNASDAAFGVPGESRCVGEDERVLGDSADVHAGVGIIGVDGAEERFERGGGHAFSGLLRLQLAPEECSSGGGGDAGGGERGVGESHRGRARQETGGKRVGG